MSKIYAIGKKIVIGIAVGVGTSLVLGAIGSIVTGSPVPLLAVLKIGAVPVPGGVAGALVGAGAAFVGDS